MIYASLWRGTGFQRKMDFRQKNNQPLLGTAISLLGFVCWTSCLLVGAIVNRRRSMALKKEGIVNGCETRTKLSRTGTCVAILPAASHLEQQTIPRAAIPHCTNHFSVVNTLRESGFDSACSIEGVQLFGGEFQIQTGEIVLELRYLPRSNDRDYWHCSMAQPRERDLRHAATGLFGNRLYSRYHRRRALFPLRIEGFHSLIGHPPAVGLAFAVIFPG